jgi:hypothetical protein
VPKNSAQNAFGNVVLAPDVIPKKIKPIMQNIMSHQRQII